LSNILTEKKEKTLGNIFLCLKHVFCFYLISVVSSYVLPFQTIIN
jgi:hypothetical protein